MCRVCDVWGGQCACAEGLRRREQKPELCAGKTFTLDQTQDGKLKALMVLEESLWEGFWGGESAEDQWGGHCSDPGQGGWTWQQQWKL